MKYLIFLVAYFLGTTPSAFLAGKIKGIDIRKQGSGNMGATNAFRVLGKKLGVLVLLVDVLKGALATGLTLHFFGPWGGIAGGLLAMLGHSFNPYFAFRPSGKGVATGLGTISILLPWETLIAVIVFLGVLFLSRYVSLASLLGAVCVLVTVFLFQEPLPYQLFAAAGALLVIFRHKSNIQRLYTGTESKIGHK